jgi:uncharacterized protein YbjT (DUF2867 family)
MAPTILIVGATGNTGRSVVETLSKQLKSTKTLSNHGILCLTRSANSDAAKILAKLPGVEFIEENWVVIDAAWLKEHHVERVFVASHNEPTQFADEGQFYVNCLQAGIKYVVRISTTAANVRPDCMVYYPRTHWAIEMMLGQPEFSAMGWTSLQPNGFSPMFLGPTAEFVKNYRQTGKQGTLSMMIDQNTPTGLVDSADVGRVAAHLLAQDDFSQHSGKRYNVSGPDNVTGAQVVELVEDIIGTKVEKVAFKDMSFIDDMASMDSKNEHLILTMKKALVTSWEGKCKAETTSKEVLDLYAPKRTVAEVLKELISE